jgi:hypothetical protein
MSSPRRRWVQALRGVMFFAIGAAILIGAAIGATAAKGAWDRNQEQQRWRAQLASGGVAEMCGKSVNQQCAQHAANKTGAEVAYINDNYAYLWVSIGTADYKAYEEGMAGDLWTEPHFSADRAKSFRFDRTVAVDGVQVTLWSLNPHRCGCPYGAPSRTTTSTNPVHSRVNRLIARATWHHDGHLYELGTFFGDDPAATLNQKFGYIRYAAPSP